MMEQPQVVETWPFIEKHYCVNDLPVEPHGEAKYWVTWRWPMGHLLFKMCEDCSQKIRTHSELIKIQSIPRESAKP